MSSLSERLDDIRVKVSLPETDVAAQLRYPNKVDLIIGESIYLLHSDRSLERCLANLAELLVNAWIREYHAALHESAIPLGEPNDPRARDFLAARAELEATGVSADGGVTISAVDLRDIDVRIKDGTTWKLSHRELAMSVEEAAEAFIDDHMAKVLKLKAQLFGTADGRLP